MLKTSEQYKKAIVAETRHILIKAAVEIISPDLVYGVGDSSGEAVFSRLDQLHDGESAVVPVATFELNRWTLDGEPAILPEDPQSIPGQHGYVSDVLCAADGVFDPQPWAELRFSGVTVLQNCSVYFPQADINGLPVDFSVSVMSGGAPVYTQEFTDNRADMVTLSGFTVNSPNAIRVTAKKWSLPYSRFRLSDIYPGVMMKWDNDVLASFGVSQQGSFSAVSLPYGTCSMEIDNTDRMFDPRNKAGMFQSMQDRQGINIYIGADLGSEVEYQKVGTYYQRDGGWSTGKDNMTLKWELVDIIGLLVERVYDVPDVLPTTLSGWVASVVAQLGAAFADRYTVAEEYADKPVTANNAAAVTNKKCGEILRWACQATETWPRAAADTGFLTVGGFWSEGNQLTTDNLNAFPVIKANGDIAAIDFTLSNGTALTVSGNNSGSETTVSITNPFLHTQDMALAAARMILSTYGGNIIETTGRGDPSSEIGDIDTVWTDESNAITGRRQAQTFNFTNGVMQTCQSTFLQADGSFLYENREVIKESGVFIVPDGVTELRLIVVGGGNGGQAGTDGEFGGSMWDTGSAGVDGVNGNGAFVNALSMSVAGGQAFDVVIGKGGDGGVSPGGFGAEGEATLFGNISSAAGKYFALGYTDISSGSTYARSGISAPVVNSGDGGKGGKGGIMGRRELEQLDPLPGYPNTPTYGYVVYTEPGKGEAGVAGADGCVVIYYDKPEVSA